MELVAVFPTFKASIAEVFLARPFPVVAITKQLMATFGINHPNDVRCLIFGDERGGLGILWRKYHNRGVFPLVVRTTTPFKVTKPRMNAHIKVDTREAAQWVVILV